MKKIVCLSALALSLSLTSAALAAEPAASGQTLTPTESQASVKGPKQFFTGDVRIDPLWNAKQPHAPFTGAYVTFEPGARSFWHTHPAGQHLLIIAGVGRTGVWEGKVQEFKTGDVLWCPAGIKHWHGASPTKGMTHLAITGMLPDGTNVQWMEEVSNAQYTAK